ncbi:RNA pyrophosphohydrolase [uncultured archaeon]|nr:RNA pyrophosphohydrolase [uncultured archaeon]
MCDVLENYYKRVKKDGITAAIIHKGRLLVLKRRFFPFIIDPGKWEFLAGGNKRGESHDDAAYREIMEETRLRKGQLRLLVKRKNVAKMDAKRSIKYYNSFYVFASNTKEIRLDIENSRYRWASFGDISRHEDYTNVFLNERSILKLIERALDEEAAERKDN